MDDVLHERELVPTPAVGQVPHHAVGQADELLNLDATTVGTSGLGRCQRATRELRVAGSPSGHRAAGSEVVRDYRRRSERQRMMRPLALGASVGLPDGHAGEVGGDGVGGVAVEVGSAHVVAQGGAGVAVPHGVLHVA